MDFESYKLKKGLKTFALISYFDAYRFVNWLWGKFKFLGYPNFRHLLIITKLLLALIYFVSGFSAVILISLISQGKEETVTFALYSLLSLLLSYIAYSSIMILRKSSSFKQDLIKLDIESIIICEDQDEIKEIMDDLIEDLRRTYKREEKTVNIFKSCIKLLCSIDFWPDIRTIRDFFKNCLIIFEDGDLVKLIPEVEKINKHIKSNSDYKILQSYIEGVYQIKPSENIFIYLNELHIKLFESKRNITNRVLNIIGQILEFTNKNTSAIMLLLTFGFIVYLFVFKHESLPSFITFITNLALKN